MAADCVRVDGTGQQARARACGREPTSVGLPHEYAKLLKMGPISLTQSVDSCRPSVRADVVACVQELKSARDPIVLAGPPCPRSRLDLIDADSPVTGLRDGEVAVTKAGREVIVERETALLRPDLLDPAQLGVKPHPVGEARDPCPSREQRDRRAIEVEHPPRDAVANRQERVPKHVRQTFASLEVVETLLRLDQLATVRVAIAGELRDARIDLLLFRFDVVLPVLQAFDDVDEIGLQAPVVLRVARGAEPSNTRFPRSLLCWRKTMRSVLNSCAPCSCSAPG